MENQEKRKVKITYRVAYTRNEIEEVIEIPEEKTYTFSRALQEVSHYLSLEHGWESEKIVELKVRLMD